MVHVLHSLVENKDSVNVKTKNEFTSEKNHATWRTVPENTEQAMKATWKTRDMQKLGLAGQIYFILLANHASHMMLEPANEWRLEHNAQQLPLKPNVTWFQ